LKSVTSSVLGHNHYKAAHPKGNCVGLAMKGYLLRSHKCIDMGCGWMRWVSKRLGLG